MSIKHIAHDAYVEKQKEVESMNHLNVKDMYKNILYKFIPHLMAKIKNDAIYYDRSIN